MDKYLSGNYKKEILQYESVEDIIKKVIPIYDSYIEDKGWSYIITEKEKESKEVSTSTTSMISYSINALMEGLLDINTDDNGNKYLENENLDVFNRSLSLLLKEFKKEDGKKVKNSFYSSTFGENDPLTLVWIRKLILNNKEFFDKVTDFKSSFNKICEDKIRRTFENIHDSKAEIFGEFIVSDHMFPLLKIVQLHDLSKKEFLDEKIDLCSVISILKNRMHTHLSLVSIENSDFDAAELVFALEALLILDLNRENYDKNILDRVFKVIREKQEISRYWRPLKPFVEDEKGKALLPLSVEIAMSLIRICMLLGKQGRKLFTDNYDIFERYTDWLKTRINIVEYNSKKIYGWCSEHIYKSNVIHTWETSQVMVYLANFNYMLEQHIAGQCLEYSKLSIKPTEQKEAWDTFEKSEPVNIKNFYVYKDIREKYIDEKNCYSMLLYGPPGTGKSTIAKKVAEAKGWDLVTVTPSDFISSGVDQVETRAKNLFKVLERQKNMVILFDEIDRLILDRDSKYYNQQSDMFQFMTPSMLVKLNDLREKKRVIFIIATNYAERIDTAVKRKGRIDNHYLVLPHNMAGRKYLFTEKVTNKLEKYKDILQSNEQEVYKKTALYTYTEFENLCKLFVSSIAALVGENLVRDKIDKIIKNIDKPSISLLSYNKKLGLTPEERNVQWPRKDFLSLVYIKAEACSSKEDAKEIFNEDERALIKGLFNKLIGNNDEIEISRFTEDDYNNLKNKIKNEKYLNDEMCDKIIYVFKCLIK